MGYLIHNDLGRRGFPSALKPVLMSFCLRPVPAQSPAVIKVYACGFNAHNQLSFESLNNHPNDIDKFVCIYTARHINLLCALWSSTVLEVDGELVLRGSQHTAINEGFIRGLGTCDVSRLYGDHTGVLGALAKDGSIWSLKADQDSLRMVPVRHHQKAQAPIQHLTIAGNGEVCICRHTSPGGRKGCEALQFKGSTLFLFTSLVDFLSDDDPKATYELPITVTQLAANSTAFTALAANGEVYTWGDPRHSHLGRTPTTTSSAYTPCLVTFLGGVPIKKVATEGWVTAAISKDNDLYVWGGRPGESERIGALPAVGQGSKDEDDEEVKLVDIDGGTDIVDVAVGEGHIVVLTAEGRVFATGRGVNGQLGTGQRYFADDWIEAVSLQGKRVIGVECALWASFAIAKADEESQGDNVVGEGSGCLTEKS